MSGSGSKNDIPKDYRDKLKAWKDELKEKWDYNRKLMIFEGSDGQIVNYTTTTSTTTTTTTPVPNITLSSPDYTSIVINTTEKDGGSVSGGVAGADTSQLVTIVAITCGSLLALMIILLIFIRMCRRSSAKHKERISLRRPLNPPEPEEHIYAEIEPLQRTSSPGGASGDSNEIQLPQKKHRKRGVSSFRALSTRIYRFFSHDASADNQSVFYNRNEQQSTVRAPEPPQRNSSPRKKRGGVQRFESTASRRALIDGDSQVSNASSVEMRPSSSAEGRNNIYNPLLREEDSRVSGPYDHLSLGRGEGTDVSDSAEVPPESPHDYFTLEANKTSPLVSNNHPLSPVSEAVSEDNDLLGNGECKSAENSEQRVSKHDYFILEPQDKKKANGSPSKSSVKSNKSSPTKEQNGSVKKSPGQSPSKDVSERPTAKPRVTKPTSKPGSPTSETLDQIETIDEVNTGDDMEDANYVDSDLSVKDTAKDDIYVLDKLGNAPEPPPEEDEYLTPKDVKKADYVDVLPNPPPRTVSLHPETVEHIPSPKKQSPQKQPLQKQESTV